MIGAEWSLLRREPHLKWGAIALLLLVGLGFCGRNVTRAGAPALALPPPPPSGPAPLGAPPMLMTRGRGHRHGCRPSGARCSVTGRSMP